jgi:hypothetical protein
VQRAMVPRLAQCSRTVLQERHWPLGELAGRSALASRPPPALARQGSCSGSPIIKVKCGNRRSGWNRRLVEQTVLTSSPSNINLRLRLNSFSARVKSSARFEIQSVGAAVSSLHTGS